MTSKMFLDIVGIITTSKLGIFKTFQGGGCLSPPLPNVKLGKINEMMTFITNLVNLVSSTEAKVLMI